MIRVNATRFALAAALAEEIGKLDQQFFDSFNHCDQPQRFAEHARWLDPKLEFYHDQGGKRK